MVDREGEEEYMEWKCVGGLKSGWKIGFRRSRLPFKCDIVLVKWMDRAAQLLHTKVHSTTHYTGDGRGDLLDTIL